MDYLLTARQEELLEWVGALADTFSDRATEHDREASFPFDNYEDMQAAGYLRLTVPEEFGGFGASLHELVLAQERLAMGCGSTALAVNMHVSPLLQMADMWRATHDPKLEPLFKDVAEGKVIWASLTSEPGISNSLTDARTRAEAVEGGFRLNGKKIFCTNTDVCTHFSLTARYEDPSRGPLIVVCRTSRDAPGLKFVRTWDTLGMRATQSVDLEISDLHVTNDDVIHRFPVNHLDAVVVKTVFAHAMPAFGAIYLGIAGGAMDWARAHILSRNPTPDSETLHLFAEIEVLRQTARAVLWRFADEVDSGELLLRRSVQEALANAVIAKYVATNAAVTILDKVIDVLGGIGFHKRFPIERMYRDVRAGTIMPYNNREALRLLGHTVFGLEILPETPLPDSIAAWARSTEVGVARR